MNSKRLFIPSLVVTFVFLVLSSLDVYADRTVHNVTLNGSANVTVSPPDYLSATITVEVNGNGAPNRWFSTEWEIGTESGCVDHQNYGDTTATESFKVTVPSVPGSYDAVFTVYGTNDCGGTSTSSNLPDAVVVIPLLVDYRFDELLWTGSADEVLDNSGNDFHATAINNPSTMAVSPAISGNPGTCRYGNFNGSGQYVEDSNADQYLEGLSAVTVMAWIRNTDSSSHDRGIFTTGAPNNNDNRFALRYDASGAFTRNNRLLKASINTSACNDSSDCLQVETESNTQSNNVWQHVAMTWESGEKIRIFIDGSEVNTTVTTSGRGVHNGTLDGVDFMRIGQGTKSANPSSEWQGNIDEFRIYDQALSDIAISQIRDETHPCIAPLAEYRFEGCDWTTGTTVIDELGSYPGVVVQGAHTAPGSIYAGGLCNVANLENDGADYNRHISLDSNPIVLSDDWTLMMWINFPPDFTQHFQAAGYRYSVVSGGTNDLAWIRQRNSDGYREWGTSSNPSAHRAAFPRDLTGWHHLTFVASEGSTDLYVDGAYSNTVNYQQAGTYTRIGTSADDAFIDDNQRQNLDTQLDELKFYANALSAQQIAEFYALENAGLRWDGTPLNCVPCAVVDHIRIEHSGSGLTCQSSDVTLRACADANCTSEATSPVRVTMTPASANPLTWIGGDTYTFTGNQTVQLRQTTPTTVTLGLTNPDPVPTNGYRCYGSGVEGNCGIEFFETGFLFDVPDLTSCQTSPAVTMRAVRMDDNSQTCVAADGFANTTKTINFWSSYVNPATGTEQISLSGADIATVSPGTGIALTFDSNATANFSVIYPDAGQMQLSARYDGVGAEEAGLVMLGNDSFVARPIGLCVYSDDANADCASGNGSCSRFKKVDEAFNLKVKGVCWESVGDTDYCTGNLTTENFQLNAIAMTHSLVAPTSSGSSAGLIGVSSIDITSTDNGEHIITNQSVSEVGVFTFTATPPDYFGEPLPAATSTNIGRFVPDHFQTSIVEHGILQDACSGFTYTGQMFTYEPSAFPQLEIQATNSAGFTTVNYRDDFVKLTNPATQIRILPAVEDIQVGTLGDSLQVVWTPDNAMLTANNDGTLNFVLGADQFVYVKEENALIDKFVSTIRLSVSQITDGDGISANNMPTHFFPTGTEIRYGRLILDNAFGPENLPLTVPVRTEYFNGSSFVPNSDDNCIAYDAADLSIIDNPSNLSINASGSGILIGGFGSGFTLSAPGEGSHGSVFLEYDLALGGADLPWLQFDWEGDGSRLNPTAKATFGIYKGNPRMIYMRESVW